MNIGYIYNKIKNKARKEGVLKTAFFVLKKLINTTISKFSEQKILNFISSVSSNKTVFIIMPIDWNHPLKQRPHHFATIFSDIGYTTIYLTPNNTYDSFYSVNLYKDRLFILPFKYSLLDKIKGSVVIFSSTEPFLDMNILFKLKNNKNYIIYDYIDEITPEISGKVDFMLDRHKYIKQNPNIIDLVSTVSLKLYNEMLSCFEKERVLYLPNGCDFWHFSKAQRNHSKIPYKIQHIVNQNKTILGYYGAMASWLDYELINQIAKELPEFNILLIGPDYDGSVKNLDNLPNIYYIGPVDYLELPDYAIYFDIAMIPFKKGDIAKSTSPIKMYEYFALGKVVLYTEDLVECSQHKTALMFNKFNLREVIYKALEFSKDEDYVRMIRQEAFENTWESRVKKIHDVLELSFR